MKLEPTKLSFYELQKERAENILTKILKNKYMNEEQKEKLRIKYNKYIEKYDFLIKKEKMKLP